MLDLVLAHQGGWDEILFVAVPVGIFALVLFVANRRARSQLDAGSTKEAGSDGQPDPGIRESGSLDGRAD